ncbi:multiheme c-type cytochrome [Gemmata sp. JC673]|uniref:Multiheme c-type cytochrome n=1 Tax=Gemmata algarum TaxID=2975278 RepID=A0ABU5F175_9BACT|nr:multiheme c-type cytochrome [Gemmata algarum]MDY3561333.1 multiheme c-type cytochrome [Gemmata algarum]
MSDPIPRLNARATVSRLFALLGFGAVLAALASGTAADPPGAVPKETLVDGKPLFADWPKDQKPDAALVLTGQTFGYLQPCGCSRPQTGGLERRAYFIDQLKKKGWPVAGVDLGDLYPEKVAVREQGTLKYVAAMNALREMGYIAVGVGETELKGGLDELLGNYIVQKEQPPFTLAGNIVGPGVDATGKPVLFPREQRFRPGAGKRPIVELTEVADVGGVPVGVAGVVGNPLAVLAREKKFDTSIDFAKPQDALVAARDALAKHPKKPRLNVLIYQGSMADAQNVAKNFPEFNVILCQASDALPPLKPNYVNTTAGTTAIVEVGHKGQHVGVVGAFKKPGGGFELRYQLVPLGEEFNQPGTDAEALQKNKALQSLQWYAERVKKDIVLGKDYPRTLHAAQIHAAELKPKGVSLRYVGAEACKACHQAEYKKWADVDPDEKSLAHSHAMKSLEKYAHRPNLRQFDGECVKCHTVGFNHSTGYEDEKKTPQLKNVGCENCHGPGSGHVADPKNKQLTELLSQWKQGLAPAPGQNAIRLPDKAFMEKMAKLGPEERGKMAQPPATQLLINRVSAMCMECHDHDADPHFDIYKNWAKIGHSGLAPPGGWPAVAPKP